MRKRDGEPVPLEGIGPPPAHLSEVEAVIWDELVSIIPEGVLGSSDRIALERASCLLNRCRTEQDSWRSANEKDLVWYLGRFGMTPSDRSKISVPKPKGADPWEDL